MQVNMLKVPTQYLFFEESQRPECPLPSVMNTYKGQRIYMIMPSLLQQPLLTPVKKGF